MENKFVVKTSIPKRLFVKVYRDFLTSGLLDGKEQIIFIHVKQYVNFTNDNGTVHDEVYPTLATLAKNVKMTEKTVRTILRSLQRKGIIRIKRQGKNKPNIYEINDSAAMWKSENVEEMEEAVDEIEERRMVEALTAKGYYISKEKEPVSAHRQATDTSTSIKNLYNDSTDGPESQECYSMPKADADEPENQGHYSMSKYDPESQEYCPKKEADVNRPESQKPDSVSKTDFDTLLDRLFTLYPVKKGRGQISASQRRKLLKIGYDEMARAIERYKRYVESVDYLHYQNGSTFFNGGYIDYLDENYDPESEAEARRNQKKSSQPKNAFNDYPTRKYDYDWIRLKKSMFD